MTVGFIRLRDHYAMTVGFIRLRDLNDGRFCWVIKS